LNTAFFIASRIANNSDKSAIANVVIRIAIIAIALSIIVMILSVAIITGFQNEIREKVIGFGSHILIQNHSTNNNAKFTYESIPVSKNQDFYKQIKNNKAVKNIQIYATKAGIIKTKTDIEGVILKGVGSDYDWSFFEKYIVDGKTFRVNDTAKTNKVIISKYIASLLKLKTGDDLFMYFIQQPPRLRKYYIEGIYQTGMEEYDKLMVIADIADIQKLNDWNDTLVSGFEVLINDFADLENQTKFVRRNVSGTFMRDGTKFKVSNIKENNSQIFDWLKLTEMNVKVIIVIMLFVSFINMAVALLIVILEKSVMIGTLKALGIKNTSIQKIFIYQAFFIIGKGLFYGNIIAIALLLIQFYGGVITLDASSYYVDKVPVNLKLIHLLALNAGTLFITLLLLIIPSFVITRIEPVKVMRFN